MYSVRYGSKNWLNNYPYPTTYRQHIQKHRLRGYFFVKYFKNVYKNWKGYKIIRPVDPQPTDTVKFWETEYGIKKPIDRLYGLYDEQSYFDEMDLVW